MTRRGWPLKGSSIALLATVLSSPLLAATIAAQEIIFADLDLAGWTKRGVVKVEVSPMPMNSSGALWDRDPTTALQITGDSEGVVRVLFGRSQIVREVVIDLRPPSTYEVDLVVIEPDGSRFAAGSRVGAGGQALTFGLLDVNSSALEVRIDNLDGTATTAIAGMSVTGEITITDLRMTEMPAFLPEGGSFPLTVLGKDDRGGWPDLSGRVELIVKPDRALALAPKGRAMTRVSGPISVQPRLGSVIGPPEPLLVIPLTAPPAPPEAAPGTDSVHLALTGTSPFEIFRRISGESTAHSLGISHGSSFLDLTVQPGTAYHYSVRRTDILNNPLSKTSTETRTRTWTQLPESYIKTGQFSVLVPLFVDSMGPGEAQRISASLEAARRFLYRHSRGQCIVDLSILPVTGPTPPTTGPTMAGIERKLQNLGVRGDHYSVIFAVSNAFSGSFAGFTLLEGTAGAIGRGHAVPTPSDTMGPDPAIAWTFVHEFIHLLTDPMAAVSGIPGLPTGHLGEDFALGRLGSGIGRPLDTGDIWDGAAALLQHYPAWSLLHPKYRRPLSIQDSDGDGLADDDPRLPYDEHRLGTDPLRLDTDEDGISDMDELSAGVYSGSDPLLLDTDGDGIADGEDPWPLHWYSGRIPWGEQPLLLAQGAPPDGPVVQACWNRQALVLSFNTMGAHDIFIDLDGSGALGRWETDAHYGDSIEDGSDLWCGERRLTIRPHLEPRGIFLGQERLPGGNLAIGRTDDGRVHVVAKIPADLPPGLSHVSLKGPGVQTTGLRLEPGTTLGLGIVLRPIGSAEADPFDPFDPGLPWQSLFETHRLYDATLADE